MARTAKIDHATGAICGHGDKVMRGVGVIGFGQPTAVRQGGMGQQAATARMVGQGAKPAVFDQRGAGVRLVVMDADEGRPGSGQNVMRAKLGFASDPVDCACGKGQGAQPVAIIMLGHKGDAVIAQPVGKDVVLRPKVQHLAQAGAIGAYRPKLIATGITFAAVPQKAGSIG